MAGLYSTILQELIYCLTKAFLLPQLSIPFPKGIQAIPKLVKKKKKNNQGFRILKFRAPIKISIFFKWLTILPPICFLNSWFFLQGFQELNTLHHYERRSPTFSELMDGRYLALLQRG